MRIDPCGGNCCSTPCSNRSRDPRDTGSDRRRDSASRVPQGRRPAHDKRFARLLTLAATESESGRSSTWGTARSAGRAIRGGVGTVRLAPGRSGRGIDHRRRRWLEKGERRPWLAGRVAELWRTIPDDRRAELAARLRSSSPRRLVTDFRPPIGIVGCACGRHPAGARRGARVCGRSLAARRVRGRRTLAAPLAGRRRCGGRAPVFECGWLDCTNSVKCGPPPRGPGTGVATDSAAVVESTEQREGALARVALERLASKLVPPRSVRLGACRHPNRTDGSQLHQRLSADLSALSREPYFRDFEMRLSQQEQRLE